MAEQVGLAGLHHVALSVRNLDASSAWYQEVLGLREEVRLQAENRRWAVLRLPGTAQQVGLVEHFEQADGFDPRHLGLDHVAFVVETQEQLAAWAERLGERDPTVSGVAETPFGGMLHFRDLDGIALALFWIR